MVSYEKLHLFLNKTHILLVTSFTSDKMDLKHSGIYRFIELDYFNTPVVIDDIAKMRHILWGLNKIKVGVFFSCYLYI
jgi:hypothetical protein